MKVLFLMEHLYPLVGGAEKSADVLLRELKTRSEFEVDYVCRTRLLEDNVDIEAYVERSDVVITQLAWAERALQLAHSFGKASVLFVRSYEGLCEQADNGMFLGQCNQTCRMCVFRKPLALRPDVVIANSRYTANFLRREHDLVAEVIYPFIDFREVIVGERQPRYITMNQLSYHKGADIFLEIAREMPEHEFRVVGYKDWEPPHAIPANVSTPGPLAPVDFYGDTSIFLAPARWKETFGRTILEARVNGIPVIATARGAAKEDQLLPEELLVEDYEDVNEWQQRLLRILSDYEAYSKAAQTLDWEKYSLTVGIENFVEVLRRLSPGAGKRKGSATER